MRFRGYIVGAAWILLPFFLPVLAAGRPTAVVPLAAAVVQDTTTVSDRARIRAGWRRLDALTPDSVFVASGICDTSLTICDFSLAARHPDSLGIGTWMVHGRDSLTQEERTQRFYDTLRVRSERNGFWRFVHGLIIVPHSGGGVPLKPEIVVLDEGRVVGVGTHSELVTEVPLYRELAKHQLLV